MASSEGAREGGPLVSMLRATLRVCVCGGGGGEGRGREGRDDFGTAYSRQTHWQSNNPRGYYAEGHLKRSRMARKSIIHVKGPEKKLLQNRAHL